MIKRDNKFYFNSGKLFPYNNVTVDLNGYELPIADLTVTEQIELIDYLGKGLSEMREALVTMLYKRYK